MIVTKEMYKNYKEDYEKEATKIYENMDDAIKDYPFLTGVNGLSSDEIKAGIMNDTNCDHKLMPDGRVFCSLPIN